MAIKTSRRIFKLIVFILCLVPLGWLVFALYSDTNFGTHYMTVDPVQKLDRELGNWALILIITTLAIRPVSELSSSRDMIDYRRMIGLFAFFYALLHVSSYLGVNLQFEVAAFIKDVVKRNYITVGIITFILLTPLAVTSSKKMIKRLGGRNWQKLHRLIYVIAILGVFHFTMMIRADFTRPIIYGTLVALLLGYRYWRQVRNSIQ